VMLVNEGDAGKWGWCW